MGYVVIVNHLSGILNVSLQLCRRWYRWIKKNVPIIKFSFCCSHIIFDRGANNTDTVYMCIRKSYGATTYIFLSHVVSNYVLYIYTHVSSIQKIPFLYLKNRLPITLSVYGFEYLFCRSTVRVYCIYSLIILTFVPAHMKLEIQPLLTLADAAWYFYLQINRHSDESSWYNFHYVTQINTASER